MAMKKLIAIDGWSSIETNYLGKHRIMKGEV